MKINSGWILIFFYFDFLEDWIVKSLAIILVNDEKSPAELSSYLASCDKQWCHSKWSLKECYTKKIVKPLLELHCILV